MESKETLYKEEIIELTELLKSSWHDLRNDLTAAKVDIEGSYLAGFMEDEEGGAFGVILTAEKKIIRFVYRDHVINMTPVNTPEEISDEFPQIHVALTM